MIAPTEKYNARGTFGSLHCFRVLFALHTPSLDKHLESLHDSVDALAGGCQRQASRCRVRMKSKASISSTVRLNRTLISISSSCQAPPEQTAGCGKDGEGLAAILSCKMSSRWRSWWETAPSATIAYQRPPCPTHLYLGTVSQCSQNSAGGPVAGWEAEVEEDT